LGFNPKAMIQVKKEGILLEKTTQSFEEMGVLNPAVIKEGEFVHVFYRAVSNGNFSTIGYCKLSGPSKVVERFAEPLILVEFDYESHGIEDPRIVKIDDLYYLTYTAYDGVNALGALATSTDLKHWKKHGLLVPKITFDEFNYMAKFKTKLNEKYFRYNEHDHILKKNGKEMFLWDKNVILFPKKLKENFISYIV
jgi:beta-1,2-mannobiose phosphorylase / 1,2-beta-oligomannan phosphorylase